MLYFDYLSQRPSAAAFGVGICQIGAVAYISDGSAWTEVGTGAGGGGIATGRTVTASDTLALTDNNTRMTANHATVNIVLTIPNDATVVWPAEASVIVYQGLAATVSFAAGAGVTLHSPVASSGQYGILTALRIGANEWTQI